MRFVPIKNIEQQAILSVHRARQGFVKARTAQSNQIRGLLSEFGIVMPQGIHSIMKRMPEMLEDSESETSSKLAKVPGIGPLTTSAIVATVAELRNLIVLNEI